MLKTYFFIPSNNPKFIEKSIKIETDYIIYDLEDAVLDNEMIVCIENLSKIAIKDNYFIRLRFFDDNNQLNENYLQSLIKLGFKNYLIPKYSNNSQLETIQKSLFSNNHKIEEFKFILIIEHPAGLINLNETLIQKTLKIVGIGLGSHDYCNVMGMKHTLENLNYARQLVLNSAKAFEIDAIDIASMNLTNEELFETECLNGFNLGFDSKFILHPKQLEIVKRIKYYSDEEVLEAETIYEKIEAIMKQEASVVRYKDRLYERPHIKGILKIINWKNKYGSK